MIELNFTSIMCAWILLGCFITIRLRKVYASKINSVNLMEKLVLFVYMIPISMIASLFWVFYKITGIKFSSIEIFDNKKIK